MKVLKISPIPWDRASRDQRELAALKESGVECLVFSKGGPKDKARKTEIAGFPVYLYDARPFGNARRLSPLNKAVTILRWARYIKTYRADILSCHDLPALLIGWLSTCCMPRRAKPKLVYDSHEFEIARNKDRTRAAVWFVTCLERFLIKRCAFTIMCCFCAADEVRKIYKLQERPIVVRNTPGFWLIDEVVIRQTRRELLSKLGVPENTFTIMYHGALMRNRGVESIVELVSMNPNIVGIILGNGDEPYTSEIHALVSERKVENRVLFHPAVTIDELWKYVGAADAGMVILKNVCANHYYALPNKLFENIQSRTPIIGSDFPEIGRIINQYGIGLTCDPDDLKAMNACVEKLRTDPAFYHTCKTNLVRAKNDLCWENEKRILMNRYNVLMQEIKR